MIKNKPNLCLSVCTSILPKDVIISSFIDFFRSGYSWHCGCISPECINILLYVNTGYITGNTGHSTSNTDYITGIVVSCALYAPLKPNALYALKNQKCTFNSRHQV